jgi:hypothetical protein
VKRQVAHVPTNPIAPADEMLRSILFCSQKRR